MLSLFGMYSDLGPARPSRFFTFAGRSRTQIRRCRSRNVNKEMTQRERRKRRISSHLYNLILFGDTNERKYFNFAPMRICVSGVCGGTGRWHLFLFTFSRSTLQLVAAHTCVFVPKCITAQSGQRNHFYYNRFSGYLRMYFF